MARSLLCILALAPSQYIQYATLTHLYVKYNLAMSFTRLSYLWRGTRSCLASFPGLSRFYLPFAFTIIHGSGRPAMIFRSCERKGKIKTGRPGTEWVYVQQCHDKKKNPPTMTSWQLPQTAICGRSSFTNHNFRPNILKPLLGYRFSNSYSILLRSCLCLLWKKVFLLCPWCEDIVVHSLHIMKKAGNASCTWHNWLL